MNRFWEVKMINTAMWYKLIALFHFISAVELLRSIQVANRNNFPIWIETSSNNNGPPLANGIVGINPGQSYRYDISDNGWAGRLWPKIGCDQRGFNCQFGQSIPPCPSGGCQPPADTKVEFYFPPVNSPAKSFYDISLVDGYTLAAQIIPNTNGQPVSDNSCVSTNCQLSLQQCPRGERNGLGDLSVRNQYGQTIACLAPCKKWNYPAPFGLGFNEQQGDGRQLCCPSPVSVNECRSGAVVHTQYVNLIRYFCPTAYSYAYDDSAGLHNCPSGSSFLVNFYS